MKLTTLKEIAKHLGVSTAYVKNHAKKGLPVGYKTSETGRPVMVAESTELDAWKK